MEHVEKEMVGEPEPPLTEEVTNPQPAAPVDSVLAQVQRYQMRKQVQLAGAGSDSGKQTSEQARHARSPHHHAKRQTKREREREQIVQRVVFLY